MRTIKAEVEIEIWEPDEKWPMFLAQHIGTGAIGEETFSIAAAGVVFVIGLDGEKRRHVYVKCDAAIQRAVKEATKP